MSCYLQNLKLNTVEDLISKALSNLYINHDEFISVNVLKECNEMKKKKYSVSFVKKNAAKKNSSVRQNKQNWFMLVSNCAICGKKIKAHKKIK